jgi:hypothetical protein
MACRADMKTRVPEQLAAARREVRAVLRLVARHQAKHVRRIAEVPAAAHLAHELLVALPRLLLDRDGEIQRVLQSQRAEVDGHREASDVG